MMKVILLLGLFALAGGRWVPDYRPLESISEREPMEEDSQMKDIDKAQFQFNLHGSDGDEAFSTDTPMPDSLEDQVEALSDSDATSGTQKDLGGEGVERQELVPGGRIISSQSDDGEDSRFMDVPADTQIVHDREDSRFMDVPADTQIVDNREDSRFMDVPVDTQIVDDREDSRFMDVPADAQIVDDREDSRFMDVPVDTQIVDDRKDSRLMDVPADAQAEDVYKY